MVKVSKVELIGWGGGPGMTFSLDIEGDISVEKNDELGLLEMTVHKGVCSPWLLPDAQGQGRGMVKCPEGRVFYVSAGAIRVMS